MRSSRVKFTPDPLAPKPLHHLPIREGMEYAMQYGGRVEEVPNTPMPIARPSLAQRVLVHRYQMSRYISRLTRPMSPLPELGYPYVHALTMIHTAPKPNQTPVMSSNGNPRTAAGGTMAPLPRFKKAIKTRPLAFNPPTY